MGSTRTRSRNGSAPESAETPSAPESAPDAEQGAPESAPDAEQGAPESAPETPSAPESAPDAEQGAPESAPETPSAETPSAPAIDFSDELESDDAERRRVRVYRDVSPRATRDDGKLVSVQREQFADGSVGALQLATITITRDKTESAQRVELESLQLNIDALSKLGVHIVRDRRA